MRIIFTLFGIISIYYFRQAIGVETIQFHCEEGWKQDGGHCYKLVDIPTSFLNAQENCERLGAHVVKIRDETENDFIYKLAQHNSRKKVWILVSNSCTAFGLFDLFEPKASSSSKQECFAQNEHGKWEVAHCSEMNWYICRTVACVEGGYRCHDDSGCISKKWVCDGERDCKLSGSDEQHCPNQCRFEERGTSGEIAVTTSDHYKDNADCMWTIIGPVGKQIKLTIEDFNTEEHRDYVHIYDHVSNRDIAMLSGQPSNKDFYMAAHQARIEFTTDASVVKSGFKIKWTSDVPELNTGFAKLTATSDWQDLTSPFYPNSPRRFYREWLIEGDAGEVIAIQLKDVIKVSNPLDKTKMTIYDGEEFDTVMYSTSQASNSLMNQLIISKTNMVRVIIHLDAVTPPGQTGYKLSYKKGCNFKMARAGGTIQSPGYVNNEYPPSTTCTWLITSPENTNQPYTINIKTIELGDMVDNVMIFDGESKTNSYHPEGGYKGIVSAGNVTVENQFYLTFTSNLIQSNGRFMIEYSLGCEEIPSSANMMISTNETTPDTTVTISCDEGYSFVQAEYNGSPEITFKCLPGGKWDKEVFPTCQVTYCGVPPAIPNGYILNYTGSVEYEAQVQYQCYDGFKINTNTPVATCLSSGFYSGGIECQASTCGDPLMVSNGVVNVTGTDFASVATYSCNDGYDLIGSVRSVCLTSGEWSHSPPLCIKKKCGVLSFIKAKSDKTESVQFGDKVTYTCENGYEINGTAEITCGPDQRFDADIMCVDIDECAKLSSCGDNFECINTIGSYRCQCKPGFMSQASSCVDINECAVIPNLCDGICKNDSGGYSCGCNSGYTLFTEDGVNNNFKPDKETGLKLGDVLRFNQSCVRNICPRPADIMNGRLLSTRHNFTYEEEVRYHCDLGFVLEGDPEIRCGNNSEWVGDLPRCVSASCDALELKGSTESKQLVSQYYGTHDNATKFGESVIIECFLNDGKKVNKSLYCGYHVGAGNYSLQGDDPQCPIIDCGPLLTIPGFKNPNLPNTFVGQSFTFECEDQFTLLGTSDRNSQNDTVVCDSTGRWKYGNLTCSGSRCSDPGTPGNAVQITDGYSVGQTVEYKCLREGYTPVPYKTLSCVQQGENFVWDRDVPKCKDSTPPKFTDCPTSPIMVKLLEEITLVVPNATDNSGLVSVSVSDNIGRKDWLLEDNNLTYVAMDGEDNKDECIVQYKIITVAPKPELLCPDQLTLKVNDTTTKVKSLPDEINSTGLLTITPSSIEYNISKINTFTQVTVIANKDQEMMSQCTFLVGVQADACLQKTLMPLENADRSCVGSPDLTCKTTCKDGAYFKNGNKMSSSTCTGSGEWSGEDANEDCINSNSPVYTYSVKIKYGFFDFFDNCKDNFERKVREELEKSTSMLNKACTKGGIGVYYQFDVENLLVVTVPGEFDKGDVSVVLRVKDTELNQAELTRCEGILKNYRDIFDVDSSTCGEGEVERLEIVKSGNTCTDEGYRLLNTSDSKIVCLPCEAGKFYNAASESCEDCPNGEYQDLVNQTSCKKCVNADDSVMPRRHQSSCIENCPLGFARTGELCFACQEDTYRATGDNCIPCPIGTSTIGVEGVESESGCKAVCKPGYYSTTGFEKCTECPMNFHSGENATTCIECENNKITNQTASTSADSCVPLTECDANPCVNGNCSYSNHQSVCACDQGYTGSSCNVKIDYCQSQPCWNNGECTSTISGYTCECPADRSCKMVIRGNFTTSETPIGKVDFVPDFAACKQRCLDNKDCFVAVAKELNGKVICALYRNVIEDTISDKPSYTMFDKNCDVNYYFIEDQCETDNINNCGPNSCTEFGYCQDKVNTSSCLCISSSYEQPRCKSKDDLCDGFCSEHGRCETFGSVRALCICDPDYTGEKCDTEIRQCDENPNGCLYNGTCVETPGMLGYSCDCKLGYTGIHCETVLPLCQASSCTNGLCYEDHDQQSPICVCEDLFTNVNGECSYKDECSESFCKNGATCSSLEGKASCSCVEGFEGSLCQHETDECQSKPCKNGGICTDLPMDQYNCSCQSGFKGSNCEFDIDDVACDVNNTNSSDDLINDFICICKPGFSGKNCSESIDECESFPCQHGGTCMDKHNDYSCSCKDGWEGKSCEEPVSYCNDTVCTDGTCISLIDDYFCQCDVGVTGQNCEQTPDVCKKISPCASTGTCKKTGGSADCECDEGYGGKSCELLRGDPCKDVQCDRGTCIKGKCECPTEYTGSECETLVDPCSSLNCPSDTTCWNPNFPSIQPTCQCPDHKVRSDATCKDTIDDFDIFLNHNIPGYKTSTSEYFNINKANGLSIILWVAYLGGEAGRTRIFMLQKSDGGTLLYLTPSHVISNQTQIELTSLGISYHLDNKKWNHIAITITPAGKIDIMMNGITLDGMDINLMAILPNHARFLIGSGFIGYVSRLRYWNRVLTMDEILATLNNPDGISNDGLSFDWKDLPNSRYQTRIYPSKLQDTTKPTYLCEYGVFNDRCTEKIDKTPPSAISCDSSNSTDKSFETDKRSTLIQDVIPTPEFNNGTTYIMNISSGPVLSWGSHDVIFVSKDEDDDHETCRYRVHITAPERTCESSPVRDVMKKGECSGTDGLAIICYTPEHQPSIPTPIVYTCGKLGSYDGLDWRTFTAVPPCGAVSSAQMAVTAVIPYIMSTSCNLQHETIMKTQIEQKLKDLNDTWNGLCVDGDCTNIKVKVECKIRLRRGTVTNDSNRIKVSFIAELLPSMLTHTNGVQLSPVDLLRLSILDSDNFDIPGVAQAKVQKAEVTINGEGSCPIGKTFIQKSCVSCGPGSFYNTTTKKCDVCDYGFYQAEAEMTSCTACSGVDQTTLAMASTNQTQCVVKCEAGSYYNKSSVSCHDCPRDFYQPEAGKDLCLPCPLPKRTRDNGSKTADECVDDCPDGSEISKTDPNDCVKCKQNYYRTASIDDVCMLCPNDKVALTEGAKSSTECIYPACNRGSFISEQMTCTLCPYGEYQDKEWKSSCKKCQNGNSTRNEGAISLDLCEFACFAGNEQKNSSINECTPCEQGFYKTDNGASVFSMCTKCEDSTKTTMGMGSTSPDDCNMTICLAGNRRFPENNTCGECPVGFYQEKDLQDNCDECLAQYTTETTGADNSSLCLFYCGAGQQVKSGANECEMCPRGQYKSDTNLLGNCMDCPDDKTTDSTGSTSDQACSLPKCSQGEVINNGSCDSCGLDKYQPKELPDSTTECLPCPSDTGTNGTGKTNKQDCKPFCSAGEQYNSDSMKCELCPQGTYNNGSTSARFEDCMKCPVNYTTVNNGSNTVGDCSLRDCPPGSKIVNTDDCKECPLGTYQPFNHQTECLPCGEKENTSSTGSINKDSCQIYCPAGEEKTGSSCSTCAADTFKPDGGYDTCTQCTGHVTSNFNRLTCDIPFCDVGAEPVNGDCNNCTQSFYKSERGNTNCMECPANYTTSSIGATSSSDCNQLHCEAGFYSKDSTCHECSVGTYNNLKGQAECKNCSSDRTTPSTGSTSESQCSLAYCDAGQYRESDLVCTNCTYGQYQNMSGSTTCEDCPGGTNTTYTGSTSIDHCLAICTSGQYRNSTDNVCADCEKGFYKSESMSFKDLCDKCPDGYTTDTTKSTSDQDCKIICPVGEYRNVTDRDACTPCSKNSYQDEEGQTDCKDCEGGKITEDIRTTAETDCFPSCSPGEYLDKDARMCEKCPLGEYSTTRGLDTSCTRCDAGKTTANTGSTSSSDCNLNACQKGEQVEAGACVPCPLGTYQNKKSQINCKKCPPGNTTLVTGSTSQSMCKDECEPGSEYGVSSEICEMCPIGYFKDDTMVHCKKCPDGQTTTKEGSTSCVISKVTESPGTRTTFTIVSEFSLSEGSCNGNIDQIRGIITTVLQDIFRAQAKLFTDVCSKVTCSNIKSTVKLCGQSRRKRDVAATNKAEATTTVRDVPVEVSSNDTKRDTQRVLEEAIYTIPKFNDGLSANGVQFESIKNITKAQPCEDGQYRQDDACVDCPTGTYYDKVNFKCIKCERGFYQPSTKQLSCIKCPNNETTTSTGSDFQSDCVSPCTVNTGYCLNSGTCEMNKDGMVCKCSEAYKGERCQSRKENQSSVGPILGGAVGGGIALMLLILIIVGCCVRLKNRRPKKKPKGSMLFPSNEKDYFYPYGSQSAAGSLGNPIKPFQNMEVPNPMYLDYRDNWEDLEQPAFYDARSSGFRRTQRSDLI